MAGLNIQYIDTDTFAISGGDYTNTFIQGRRVKLNCGVDGYAFGTIESAYVSGGSTYVDLTSTSDPLSASCNECWYGIVGGGAEDQSMPIHSHDGSEGSGGKIVYGSEFQETSDNIMSSTTSTSYQQKLRMTTTSLPSGSYCISFYSETINSVTSGSVEWRIQLNDTILIASAENMPSHPNDVFSNGGFYITTLSGINTIDIDWKRIGISGVSRIRRARLALWRVE
jgi:hypothetical protein